MTTPDVRELSEPILSKLRGSTLAAVVRYVRRRPDLRLPVAVVSLGWVAWATYSNLGAGRDVTVPVDWVGLAYAWTGLALVMVGLVASWRGPVSRTGRLMAVCGLLFLIPSLTLVHTPIIWTIGALFSSAYQPVLIYLVLAFPDGRLSGLAARLVMYAAVVRAVGWGPVMAPLSVPEIFGCVGCPPSTNLLYVPGHEALTNTVIVTLAHFSFIMWASLLAVVTWRLASATPPGRRALAPVYAPAFVWIGANMVVASTLFLDWIPFDPAQLAGLVALALLPFGFAFGLLRARARRLSVSDLALELQSQGDPKALQAAVARALGDPTAQIGYWSDAEGRYLTADQTPLELPAEGGQRIAAHLDDAGRPAAVLVHDAAIQHNLPLVQGVSAVVRLAILNQRLAAEVQEQLMEVRASRARIVAASDAERKRVERNLHDGAQQRLVTLSLQLRLLGQQIDVGSPHLSQLLVQAVDELNTALAELRELAQGVHPSVLTDHGLAAALEYLAERAPVPVSVEAPTERFAAALESTAYFIALEALTNVAKYAGARRVSVHVTRHNGVLKVEVCDDGVGGADPHNGTGLRGLADRAAALGGHLRIDSTRGQGTRITAELPCA